MVTPTSLNGAGCAVALPAVSDDASNNATNTAVFMNASLLSRCFPASGECYQVAGMCESGRPRRCELKLPYVLLAGAGSPKGRSGKSAAVALRQRQRVAHDRNTLATKNETGQGESA
jgi:hypothetical protein